MGFRTERRSDSRDGRSSTAVEDRYAAASSFDDDRYQEWREDGDASATRRESTYSREECADLFGFELYRDGQEVQLQRLADSHGAGKVRRWADEGMTPDTMGKPHDMEQFRERQKERPVEVPWDVERRNAMSVQRSRDAQFDSAKAGDTGVPDSVRDVVGSPGQQLDDSIQQAIEERMGDNLGDVRIHTGPQAAKACEDINARAFTVGNHVAFNTGEYDPESAEGQHVLAHELAHVRQQTGGAVSMLPQTGEGLEIDPDERLEREAEETAERVMRGGAVGVPGMGDADVHVQRMPAEMVPQALEMFKQENEGGVGSFQQSQNEDRIEFIEDEIQWAIDNISTHEEALERQDEIIIDARMRGNEERASSLEDAKGNIQDRIGELFEHIQEKADQIGLTDEQREKLYGDNDFDGGKALAELSWTTIKSVISVTTGLGPIIAAYEIGETTLRQLWDQTDGSLTERLHQVKELVMNEADTDDGISVEDYS